MKIKLFLIGIVVFALTSGMMWSSIVARAEPTCDPDYVTQAGNTITVLPTGVDDTVDLQCAFDIAVASGPGSNVHLQTGTYKTGQIVATGFRGRFTGEGASKTKISNLLHLYVEPVYDPIDPPSASGPWPSLFAFIGGDFVISDMAISISGDDDLTTGWSYLGLIPPTEELAHGIVILGDEAHARIERILLEGELMENSLFGYNVLNGIYFEGELGDPKSPISGSFEVYDSTFRQIGFAVPVFNLRDASVVISRNTFEGSIDGTDSADLVDSTLEFSHNMVDAVLGLWFWNNLASEDTGSSYLASNNIFRGGYGVYIENTFGSGVRCQILGNNTQNVEFTGVYLGPGTSRCTVVGGSNKTNVFDEGHDNVLVGVNNMGTGVGPTLTQFIRPGK